MKLIDTDGKELDRVEIPWQYTEEVLRYVGVIGLLYYKRIGYSVSEITVWSDPTTIVPDVKAHVSILFIDADWREVK